MVMTPDPTPVSLRDFRAMYRAHHGLVWHALHRFGVDHAVIEDAVQDVFVVAYRRRFDVTGSSTKAWLYGIARRVASNYRRADRRRVQRESSVHATQRRHEHANPSVREAIHVLDRYLADLPEDDREIFLLSELEGMTGPEIAIARGRNVNTVYTRIGKLRRDLQDRLSDLERAREARPRATARQWAAIVPLLREPVVAGAVVLGKTAIAFAIGAAAASGVLVVADRMLASEEPPVVTAVRTDDRAHAADPDPGGSAPASSERAAAPTEIVEPTAEIVQPEAPVLSPTSAGPRAVPAKARGVVEPASASPSRDDDLATQNALLAEATTAIREHRAAEALRITDAHATRFPKSPFADLRTALRIEALCALGKTPQARAEGRNFLDKQPGSPVSKRISESCAGPPRKRPQADTPGT